MKRIVYTAPDGGLRILLPVEGARLCSRLTLSDGTELICKEPSPVEDVFGKWRDAVVEWAETPEQFLDRIREKDVPADAINVRVIDVSEIPADRTFRNAWRDTGTVCVDMEKARDLHRDHLRAMRAPKLAALDVAYMMALEAGDLARQALVATKKHELRDVTAAPAITAAETPEELKVAIPVCLQACLTV